MAVIPEDEQSDSGGIEGAEDTDDDGQPDASMPESPPGAVDSDDDGELDQSRPEGPEGATDTDDDGRPDASFPDDSSGGGGGRDLEDVLDDVDEVSSGGGGEKSSGDPSKSKGERALEQAKEIFSPSDADQSKTEKAKEFVRDKGLEEAENVRQAVEENLPLQSPQVKETAASFVENLQAEEKAQELKERTQEQIRKLEGMEGNKAVIEEGGEREVLSQDQAVERLESQREKISGTISQAQENQEILAEGPPEKPGVIPFEEIPGMDRSDFQDRQGEENVPTDNKFTTQYAGGTNIPGGKSRTNPMSDQEMRETFQDQREQFGDLLTVTVTGAGLKTPFAAIDPDKTVSGVIEEEEQEARNQDFGGRLMESLGSPAGIVATAGAGKVLSSGIRGLQAYGIGTGRTAQALGVGAQAGGGLLVGSQIGTGSGKLSEGKITEGGAQILQVTAEAGAFTKGLRSGARKYGPQLGGSTKVEQENILKRVARDEDSFLVGSGRMEAETPIVQRVPFKGSDPQDLKRTGTAVSQADYRVVSDQSGAEAQGIITDNIPGRPENTRKFESFSNVVSRNDDKIVSNNILRAEDEGLLFRRFSDQKSTTVTRKQSESPISEVRSFDVARVNEPVEVEDALGRTNIVGRLEADVLDQVRRGNLDAKNIQFTSYTRGEDGGTVFSETSSLVLDGKTGRGSGAGGSGGQRFQYGSRFGDGGAVETRRQREAGQQFGQEARKTARSEISTGDDFQGYFPSSGGSGGSGAEAGLDSEARTQRTSVDVEAPETQGSETSFSGAGGGETITRRRETFDGGESGGVTQGYSGGTLQRNRGESAETGFSGPESGLRSDQRLGLDQGQGRSQGTRGRSGLQRTNRLQNTQIPQLNQVQGAGTRTLTIPRMETRAGLETTQLITPGTTAVQGPPASPGAGMLMNPETGNPELFGGFKAGKNIEGSGEDQVQLDILSANRAELVTGKKTFDLSGEESGGTLFSGGVKTEEEKNLGPRKYLSDNDRRLM